MDMEIKFVIKARTINGIVYACFNWTKDAESGIRRAYIDAAKFKVKLVEVWAESVSSRKLKLS